ncbi:MAG: hypothetical protein RMI90_01320 [Thermoguttaceae bacterium]|nr:hypothetical protein [Thermoguttaceae bacterium]
MRLLFAIWLPRCFSRTTEALLGQRPEMGHVVRCRHCHQIGGHSGRNPRLAVAWRAFASGGLPVVPYHSTQWAAAVGQRLTISVYGYLL